MFAYRRRGNNERINRGELHPLSVPPAENLLCVRVKASVRIGKTLSDRLNFGVDLRQNARPVRGRDNDVHHPRCKRHRLDKTGASENEMIPLYILE